MAKKIFKITLFSVLGVIGIIILFFLTLFLVCVVEGYSSENACIVQQDERILELKESYANQQAVKVDEQSFCDFDLQNISNIKYNKLRTLGTHNSYKKAPNKSAEFLMNIVVPMFAGGVVDESSYFHESLTDQLNKGLRTFELDAIKSVDNGKVKILSQHAPLFDGNSWLIDLAKGFEEMVMWSDYNEGHMPVTILIECKTKFLVKIGTHAFDNEAVNTLNSVVGEVFKDKLMTPKLMLGNYSNFNELRKDNGYKTLNDMQNKFVVILHPGDLTQTYLQKSIESMNMFAASTTNDDVLFTVLNNPYDTHIQSAMHNNFIVRTRVDSYLDYNEHRKKQALSCNAQILSSDYVPRKEPIPGQYVCDIFNTHTISLVK